MICIAGKNQIAINAISYLIKSGYKKLCVIVNNSDLGYDTWQPSLKKFAIENNIPILDLERVYSIENLTFISLEFDKLINPLKFKSNNLFNFHFSCLPSYKGAYTSIWPILNNEKFSGVSLHKIDHGIDTGNIIEIKKFEIDIDMTSRDLYLKYMSVGKELFIKRIQSILKNNFKEFGQAIEKSSFYSRSSINFEDLKLNFKNTSLNIHNYIRAFTFKEYQTLNFEDKIINKSQLINERSKGKPGQIISIEQNYLDVSTIDYNIRIFFEK